uniref:Uncharacterized protein n=1 Tax=Arundo donax TaxID=35708 RepID=A0A0A8YS58_ARUDO
MFIVLCLIYLATFTAFMQRILLLEMLPAQKYSKD